jgi:hypothetical protein
VGEGEAGYGSASAHIMCLISSRDLYTVLNMFFTNIVIYFGKHKIYGLIGTRTQYAFSSLNTSNDVVF